MASSEKNLSTYSTGNLTGVNTKKFAIIVSEWNETVTESLYSGALETLLRNGAARENIVRKNVPGSFELSLAAQWMAKMEDIDAVICLGCVIQGETKHFDFVCQAVSQGIKDLNVLNDIPVIFCVLTDQHLQQAIDRSGGRHGNKGAEAAVAAIKMAQLRKDAR